MRFGRMLLLRLLIAFSVLTFSAPAEATNYLASANVQQFTCTIASGSLTCAATINAVGSGAFITYGGVNPSVSNNLAEDVAYLTKTNATTITATRVTSTAGTVVVTGSITDGDTTNLIKSVQYGTVSMTATAATGTATISAITNANTAIAYLGRDEGTGAWDSRQDTYLTLSGTTVTATRGSGGGVGSALVGFVAIEFQGSALNQAVQNVTTASTSNVTSWTSTITSVNTNNTICFYGGGNNNVTNTNPAQTLLRGSLTNGTTFTVNVNTGNLNTRTLTASIVEFAPGVFNSAVQRGTTTLTAATSNTSTITGVTATNSLMNFIGQTATSTTAVLDRSLASVALTNGTTVTTTKATATANLTDSWEVGEFSTSGGGVVLTNPRNQFFFHGWP